MRMPDNLIQIAKTAAEKYLSADKCDMNFTITEHAKTAGLNDDQIHRVCETANQLVQHAVVDKQQRYTAFDVADPVKVKTAVRSLEGEIDAKAIKPRVLRTYIPDTKTKVKAAQVKEADIDLNYNLIKKDLVDTQHDLTIKEAEVVDLLIKMGSTIGIDNINSYLANICPSMDADIRNHLVMTATHDGRLMPKTASVIFVQDDDDANTVRDMWSMMEKSASLHAKLEYLDAR